MGIETIITAMKEVLQDNGFKERVFVFDLNKLNDPTISSMIMLQLGRMGEDVVDTYGATFARPWVVMATFYQALGHQTGEEAHGQLMVDLDKFIDALELKFHLGKGKASNIRKVQVLNFTTPTVIEVGTEEEVINWLRSTSNVLVEETSTPGAGAE